MPSSNTSNNSVPEQTKREIEQLSETLNRYQHEYYVLSRPTVSDAEYDRLFDRLMQLEREYPEARRTDSPTQRVGSDLTQELPEVSHTIPVLSLDKAYGAQDLEAWMVKTVRNAGRPLSFMVEEKIDGASIVLYYEQGLLVRAVTRGNGIVGNDVTANVKTIREVPLRLSRAVSLAVRGEVFLPRSLFERINAKLETPYANPRNLAAGTLRRVKSADVAAVPLRILIYEGYPASPPETHAQVLEQLEQLGFKLNPNISLFCAREQLETLGRQHPGWKPAPLSDLPAALETARSSRRKLDYEIDGLVVKVNELPARRSLGFTGHHPRWAIAFKFEAPEAESIVENIEVQVGRTGRITPVARIKPVRLSGSTISNATLHNQDYIEMLELAIGDRVSVSKRGDVIPAVERVVEKNESGNSTWQIPGTCPSCGSSLTRQGAHHFCINPACPDQIRGRIRFFVGRNQMDIDNLGPETLEVLIDRGLVKDVQDLYTFDPQVLLDLPGFGEKKVRLIREGLQNSKNRSYRNVLVSLGIPEIGQKAVDLLVEGGFRDIQSLIAAAKAGDPAVFTAIHGIGQKIAQTLIEELHQPAVRSRIDALKAAGLRLREESSNQEQSESQILAGQTWCVTGSFETFKPRELAVEEIKSRGGRVTATVTGKTTHLLAGSAAGSKLEKARSLGVYIVDEKEFLEMIASEPDPRN